MSPSNHPSKIVISTEAAHGSIVSRAVERSRILQLHVFAVVVVFAIAFATAKSLKPPIPKKNCVIPTEATHSLIVSGAVEGPPHFAVVVVAVAVVVVVAVVAVVVVVVVVVAVVVAVAVAVGVGVGVVVVVAVILNAVKDPEELHAATAARIFRPIPSTYPGGRAPIAHRAAVFFPRSA